MSDGQWTDYWNNTTDFTGRYEIIRTHLVDDKRKNYELRSSCSRNSWDSIDLYWYEFDDEVMATGCNILYYHFSGSWFILYNYFQSSGRGHRWVRSFLFLEISVIFRKIGVQAVQSQFVLAKHGIKQLFLGDVISSCNCKF